MSQERSLPRSPDSERAVLGGLMLDASHLAALADTLASTDPWHGLPPDVRRVVLRLGPVLDRKTGPFPAMLGLTRKFLGGAAGSGGHPGRRCGGEGAVDRADLHDFAFLDEERHLDHEAGLELGGLLHVAGRVALHSVGGFNHLECNRRGGSAIS